MMSENNEVFLYHFLHQHPLFLTNLTQADVGIYCYGCRRLIFPGEAIYRCRENYPCGITFHEECAEMPREITLSLHPQHTLIQNLKPLFSTFTCAVCEDRITDIGYFCSSSDSCEFQIHVGCVQSFDMMGEARCTKHPSHPQHDLKLLWRPGRAASFRCDACGVIHRGNSYICTVCQYCINETCAVLPATVDCLHLHGHPLSLAYRLPLEYIKYRFRCDVCFKELCPKYWVYHCGICRYVVHINCAFKITSSKSNIDGDVVAFPTNDVAEEVIGPFVTKLGVSVVSNDIELVKGKYKLHNHDHQLRLISSSLHDQEEENKDEESCNDDDVDEEEEEDDADLNYELKSKIVCDGCTAPISSASKYISCGECNYFLHLACFQLPSELSFHPLHPKHRHILTLQIRPKLNFVRCTVCQFNTNGLFYGCNECSFKVDIKCAALPDTIKHAAHPQHLLNILTQDMTEDLSYLSHMCNACGSSAYISVCSYRCDVCQIIFHSKCVLLPPKVSNRRWDKHPLPLTFDATANHPSDFYCEACEEKINPRTWMYHCRDRDVSIHPSCLKTVGGQYRNIKFGQRCDVGALHQHPVVYQLTNKLRCNVCGRRKVYGTQGFQCASHKCDFVMCSVPCRFKNAIHAID